MSVAFQGKIGQPSKVRRRPTWVEGGDGPVFACVHEPTLRQAQGVVVIVGTFGPEAVSAHRTLMALADSLATCGFAAVRFDLSGTGDSSDLGPDPAAAWRSDVAGIMRLAESLGEGLPRHVVGFRLGACLLEPAVSWADSIVCWQPTSGRHLLRAGRLLRNASIPIPPLPSEQGAELCGAILTPEQVASIGTLRPLDTGATDRATEIWMTPEDASASYEVVPTLACAPFRAVTPVLDAIPPAPRRPLADWQPVDTVTFDVDGVAVREQILEVGPDRLPSILTEAVEVEPRASFVFSAPGVEPRSAPVALWTTAARQLARLGAPTLRSDRRDQGEAITPGALTAPPVYQQSGLDDARHSAQWLRSRYGVSVIAVGSCSSAWIFIKAAQEPGLLDRVIAFNMVAWRLGINEVQAMTEAAIGRALDPEEDPTLEILPPADAVSTKVHVVTRARGLVAVVERRLKVPNLEARIAARVKAAQIRGVAKVPDRLWRRLAVRGLVQDPSLMLELVDPATKIELHSETVWPFFERTRGPRAVARVGRTHAIESSLWHDLEHNLMAETARQRTLAILRDAVEAS